jgi:tetratricopeptide (TPR) repeat protein
MSDGRKRLAIGATLLFLLVFAVYLPAIRGGFVWDDRLLVDKNPLVTGKFNLLSLWFQTDFPLTWIAFWLQWLAWGKSAMGYHIVNVFVHALGAVIAWRVLVRLKIPGAWLGAALFAVHPLCVASAGWISELKNTLSLTFYLLSALWYLDSESKVQSPKSKVTGTEGPPIGSAAPVAAAGTLDFRPATIDYLYWCSLGAFLLALLSKTSTVMLPLTLLVCAWWQKGRITKRDVIRTAPFFALALGFGLLTVWFQKHQAMGGVPVQTEGFAARLAGAAWAIWFYLGKALWPLNLNMIYPRWTIDATRPLAWVPLLLLAAALGACWIFRRSWGRPLLFALGFFTINLFPALGFFDMYYLALSRVSDHFVYLSLLGLIALVAAGLWLGSQTVSRVTNQGSRVVPLAGAIVLVPLAALSLQRARVLANDETLWRDTLAKNPRAWTAHNNLGCLLAERQQYGDAVKEFEASLKANPRNAQAHANLARALAVQGKIAEAEGHLRTALELKPNDAEIQRSIGSMLAGQGKLKEALPHLREAARLEPNAETRLQYAGLLHQTGDAREAISEYRQALALDSNLVEALNNLAWLLATTGDASLRNGSEAVRAAERACKLTNRHAAVPLGTLAAAYAEAGRYPEAVRAAELSIQIATAANQQQIVAMNQQFLNFYRVGKAWHQPLAGKPQTPTTNPQ